MDYHVHSKYSFDGKSTLNEICNAAVSKDMNELCITEHHCYDSKDPSFEVLQYEAYENEVMRLRDKYGDKFCLKLGLEIGEPHRYHSLVKDFLSARKLDFIIGSVHNIESKTLRNYITDKDPLTAYHDYFMEVYHLAGTGEYDVLGHLDLMKRYAINSHGNYKYEQFQEILGSILETVISRGKGIEVNTSGWRDDVMDIYPTLEVLKLYKELGGEIITVGSDSHSYDCLGNHIERAYDILRTLGFKYVHTFTQREPQGKRI